MTNLIQELQAEVLNNNRSILDVLMKALYVCKKLELPNFEKFVNLELEGYVNDEDVPAYRCLQGRLKGSNPFRGWQPIHSGEEYFLHIKQPIGQLENLAKKGTTLKMHLNPKLENSVRKSIYSGGSVHEIAFHFCPEQVMGVVNKVRIDVLKWASDLDKAGIKVEGQSFSDSERQSAQISEAVVNNYFGGTHSTFGSLSNSQINQGNSCSNQLCVNMYDKEPIIELLKEIDKNIHLFNGTEEQKAEVGADIDVLKAQVKSPNPKVPIIKEALKSLKNIFEGATGGIIANLALMITGLLDKI